jgi:hypothetical protein
MSALHPNPVKKNCKKGGCFGFSTVNDRYHLILLVVFLLLFLSACNLPLPVSKTPTEIIVRAVYPTSEASLVPISNIEISPSPSLSPTIKLISSEIPPMVSPTLEQTQRVPTAFPTSTSTPIPTSTRSASKQTTSISNSRPSLPAILIDAPGPLSKIASPIYLEAGAIPGDDGMLYLDVTGEDGRSIFSKALNFSNSPYRRAYFSRNIDFEIPSVAETIRISLSTKDFYGRLESVSSVDVILVQLGDDLINPIAMSLEPYFIQDPKPDQIISGGTVHVTGLLRPVNTSPLILDLIDQKGVILATQSLLVSLIDSQQEYANFSVDIPYSISTETRVRLTLHQDSDNRLPGVIALNSVTLVLRP